MTRAFGDYVIVVLAVALPAVFLIGWRRVTRPYRLIGWFLLGFIVTYLLRPLGTEVLSGDRFLYEWLSISPIEGFWWPMTLAVSLATICVAIGYRSGSRRLRTTRRATDLDQPAERIAGDRFALGLSLCLVGWGYLSVLLSGVVGGEFVNPENLPFGVAIGTSAWISESNLFVTSGVTLLYIATGRLWYSILLAIPWLASSITNGYGRINVLGLFMALLCTWLLRGSVGRRRLPISHGALIVGTLVLVLLAFFPGTKQSRTFFAEYPGVGGVQQAFQLNFEPQTWLATTSDVMGYETTLYHLQRDTEPAWGTYYLYYAALQPIPRLLWEDKPVPTTLAEHWLGIQPDLRYLQLGLAPGAVGMAFQQWGWVGIPLEFIFAGWFFRRAEEMAIRRYRRPHIMLTYAGLFSLLPQIGRDGLIYMLTQRWLFIYGLPVMIMLIASRARKRHKLGVPPTHGGLPSERRLPRNRLPGSTVTGKALGGGSVRRAY
jgi:hypothetical protein